METTQILCKDILCTSLYRRNMYNKINFSRTIINNIQLGCDNWNLNCYSTFEALTVTIIDTLQ